MSVAEPAPAPRLRTPTHLVVTGGAGFIGSNFVHRSLHTRPEANLRVVDALTYAGNPANLRTEDGQPLERAFPGRFHFHQQDILDTAGFADVLAAAIADAGSPEQVAVVHFAAESHNDNSLADPAIFARTNVEGTVSVAQAAATAGVHLHHISTDEVFGDLALDDPTRFTVDTPYRPSSPYSASKAAADHFVRAFVRSRGLSATISNCSNNYGPRQHPEKFIPRQITGLIDGELPRLYGSGDNVRDWIHVDDHNDAAWAVLERGEAGRTYLIGAEGERSNRQVVDAILAEFGHQPGSAIRVTDRPGHDRRYAIDPSSSFALGWRPRHTDFAEGLAQTVAWYRDNPQWWRAARDAAERTYRLHERELPEREGGMGAGAQRP